MGRQWKWAKGLWGSQLVSTRHCPHHDALPGEMCLDHVLESSYTAISNLPEVSRQAKELTCSFLAQVKFLLKKRGSLFILYKFIFQQLSTQVGLVTKKSQFLKGETS